MSADHEEMQGIGPEGDGPSHAGEESGPPAAPRFRLPGVPVDHEAMHRLEDTSPVRWCGAIRIHGGRNSSGEVFSVPRLCRSWWCAGCGPWRAEEEIKHAWRLFRDCPAIFFTTFDAEDQAFARLRRRRRGEPWLLVIRNDSSADTVVEKRLCYFSPVPRPGPYPPDTFAELTPAQAVTLLAGCLALPGVEKVMHSKAWAPRARVSGEDANTTWFGGFGEGTFRRATRAAMDQARFRYGVGEWDPQWEQTPGDVSVKDFFDSIEVALNAQRGKGRSR